MANIEGIITENIRDRIAPGQAVYDKMGSRVGEVSSVIRQTGYFTVDMTPFSKEEGPRPRTDLYAPFSLITSIDLHELFLSVTTDELQREFAHWPARTVVVEGAPGSEVAVTTESNGYDGTPIVVERVPIGALRNRISVGDRVSTADYVDLGTIKQYDPLTGWMLVEKHLPPEKHDLMIPLSVVAQVDDSAHEVRLVTSQADLQRMQHLEPANVVFTNVEITEAR